MSVKSNPLVTAAYVLMELNDFRLRHLLQSGPLVKPLLVFSFILKFCLYLISRSFLTVKRLSLVVFVCFVPSGGTSREMPANQSLI